MVRARIGWGLIEYVKSKMIAKVLFQIVEVNERKGDVVS